jgi:predicted Zn-dependent protease
MKKKLIPFLLFTVLILPGFGAVPSVSPELGKTLEAVQTAIQAEQWEEAVAVLNKFKGERNALWYNTLGQIYLAQGDPQQAEKPLRTAFKVNQDEQFGITLAVCLVELDQKQEALELFGRYLNLSTCDQSALESYLYLAVQVNDTRLVRELTRFGLMRFPGSSYLREMDLNQAVEDGQAADILRATDVMLVQEPLEERWWQTRASGSEDQSDLQLARLEAAVLANPDDLQLRRQHLLAQLSARHRQEAMKQAKVIMQHQPDSDTALYCVQAAVMLEDYQTASQWLDGFEQTDDLRYWQVRAVVSLHAKQFDKANEALLALLKFPEPDLTLWRWAAHLAVSEPAPEYAEPWLRQGLTLDSDYSTPIALDYARWLINEDRPEEAADALRSYLAKYPEEASAHALLQLVESE